MSVALDKDSLGSVVQFLIGDQKRPMMIHTALIAGLSPTLRSLVSGAMEEAQSKTVIWDDVNEDTFARFAQFVYTGDYLNPSFTVEGDLGNLPLDGIAKTIPPYKAAESPLPEEPQDTSFDVVNISEQDDWANFSRSTKTSKKPRKVADRTRPQNQTRFFTLAYPLPAPSSNFVEACKPRPNQDPTEDYTPVFLGHGQLYVLADKYDIKPLKNLVLNKLHSTLCIFNLYETRYGDVLELVKYTYEHTYEHTAPLKRVDQLRELVTLYVAYHAKPVVSSPEGLALVEAGGSFAKDLVSVMLERVD